MNLLRGAGPAGTWGGSLWQEDAGNSTRGPLYVPVLFSNFKVDFHVREPGLWTIFAGSTRSHHAAMACFTASTSCLRLKGLGRKLKSSPSGRFFLKASSA